MTEEEKDKLRQAKADVTDLLAGMPIERYRLDEVDSRLDSYVREVAGNPDAHNLYEQLAVARFFHLCDRYGINVTEVWQFCDFYESLYFPGKAGQQRYKLTPVQYFQFASIFAFWVDDKRVVREVVLYVPRKFSKTTSTASLAIYDLLYGDANAE
ncbi:MAG: terminase large subunit, partial [Clostridia bacterium]|nr:terminase large subunit [Clostridia bacterium]